MTKRDRFRGTRSRDNIDKYLSPEHDGMKMYDLENPDIGLFNMIDSEQIRLAGSPVLVYRYLGENNYDDVLDEDPERQYDVNPALCDAHYDPRMFEEPLANFGIEMSQDQLFTFNKNDIMHQLGREIKTGDLIFTKFQNTLFEVTEVQEDSFESYGVYHLVASAKVMRNYERLLTILGLNRFFRRNGGGTGSQGPPKASGLKDQANLKILIGGMANEELANDADLRSLIVKEYNMLAMGNGLKWRKLLVDPRDSSQGYDFTNADAFVAFANQNDILMKGHTLVWSDADFFPNDFPARNKVAREQATANHISTVVGHFKGKVGVWDVWNEAVDNAGNGLKTLPEIPPVDELEIGKAFVAAAAADPDAMLILNDFQVAGGNKKTDTYFTLAKTLKDGGAPIDGVGFQMHIDLGEPEGSSKHPNKAQLQNTIARYADEGLDVLITELDIRIANLPATMSTQEKLEAQQAYAKMVLEVCNKAPNCHSVSTWGVTDKYSWIYERFGIPFPQERPLPFGQNLERKPFYDGLYEGIKTKK